MFPLPLLFWTRVPGMSRCERLKSSRFMFLTSSLCVLQVHWCLRTTGLEEIEHCHFYLLRALVSLDHPAFPLLPPSPSAAVSKNTLQPVLLQLPGSKKAGLDYWGHIWGCSYSSVPPQFHTPLPPTPYTQRWWKYSRAWCLLDTVADMSGKSW